MLIVVYSLTSCVYSWRPRWVLLLKSYLPLSPDLLLMRTRFPTRLLLRLPSSLTKLSIHHITKQTTRADHLGGGLGGYQLLTLSLFFYYYYYLRDFFFTAVNPALLYTSALSCFPQFNSNFPFSSTSSALVFILFIPISIISSFLHSPTPLLLLLLPLFRLLDSELVYSPGPQHWLASMKWCN